jgi:segregation and condensation protein B
VEIDKLRGVGSVQMVRKLVAKGFIKEVGRSELPGRPILYETTSEFLDYFGLSTIEDLPDMRDFLEENESVEEDNESDLYTSKYVEDELYWLDINEDDIEEIVIYDENEQWQQIITK